MAWTTPKTNWATGELVTAQDMNAVGENLATLRNAATASGTTTADINFQRVDDYVDVDSDTLNLSITTSGGDVLACFHGLVASRDNYTQNFHLDIDVDGNRQGGDVGILHSQVNKNSSATSFTYLIRNLGAGAHTIKLQYQHDRDRIKLRAGAHFWVREI